MSDQCCTILNWNVRGLNMPARRKVVRDLCLETKCTIAALQETKLSSFDDGTVSDTLGANFLHGYAYLPAMGTRGGILLAADNNYFSISEVSTASYSLTAKVTSCLNNAVWHITVVYGPQGDQEKLLFLQELRNVSMAVGDSWLIIGDFNLILNSADKSNSNLNRRLMGAFGSMVNDLELKELNLRGRKYTWSNEITHSRIDRAFCSSDWDLLFPDCTLQALSSSSSDHAPLLLVGSAAARKYTGFRFEVFWPSIPGYHEVVANAWNKPVHVSNPHLRLHTKLQRTSKALKSWANSIIGHNKLLLCAAKLLILTFDVVQEFRSLSSEEVLLKRDLRNKILGMSAVEKIRAKQKSRLKYVKASEAGSKLFLLHANGRKRKNFIHSLVGPTGAAHSHEEKEDIILQHFKKQLGESVHRNFTLNWEELNLQSHDLSHLEEEFTEEEIKEIVSHLPPDKAAGPDGYIGLFLKSSWEVIKGDVLSACNYFFSCRYQHLKHLNSAHIVLIPKKADATSVKDFRPISLTHCVAKLISKVLASRLAGSLSMLVSRSQSAFIKRRSIQDNFTYTQNLINELHSAKRPTLFLKLDISKAFDSVRWDFLMEVLEHMGFGCRWRNWVSGLLSTSSSSVLLNGVRGGWIMHKQGLRQGDPLSPMLFILAMEPLQRMLDIVSQHELLSPIQHRQAKLRISLYADDAAIFINPNSEEIQVVQKVLEDFGSASGLITNFSKSAIYPVRCDDLDIDSMAQPLHCPVKQLPCTYLGLPLSLRKLRKIEVQPLLEKMAAKLPAWKGKFLNRAGRLRLINSALSTIPIYFLTAFNIPKWAYKKMDKMRRAFLWKGASEVNGGHYLVNWRQVCRPKVWGGLGILDLEMFSRALRVRWLWYEWNDSERPWVGTEPPVNNIDRQFFRVSTTVSLGNGEKASFWESSWLNGQAPMDLFPRLYKLAWRKRRKVKEEIEYHSWIRGLWRMEDADEMTEFVILWGHVLQIHLTDQPDLMSWRWTADGIYTAKSAYMAQFTGAAKRFKGEDIWKANAEGKHKFFSWLMIQSKVLTADKLLKRNWPCNPNCSLCDQELETANHLFLRCSFSRQVWLLVATWAQEQFAIPVPLDQNVNNMDWWNSELLGLPKQQKRKKAGYMMYVVWNIWKERNRRIFEGVSKSPAHLLQDIKSEKNLRDMALGNELEPVLFNDH